MHAHIEIFGVVTTFRRANGIDVLCMPSMPIREFCYYKSRRRLFSFTPRPLYFGERATP